MSTAQERSQLAAFNRRLRKLLGALGELRAPATARVTQALTDAFGRHKGAESNRQRSELALVAAREKMRGPRQALLVLVESASYLSGLTHTDMPRESRAGPITGHLLRADHVLSQLEAIPDSVGIRRRLHEVREGARAAHEAVGVEEEALRGARAEVYRAVIDIQDALQLTESFLKRNLPADSPALKRVFGKRRRVKPGTDEEVAIVDSKPVEAVNLAPPEARVAAAGDEKPAGPGPSPEPKPDGTEATAPARHDPPGAPIRRRLARAHARRPVLVEVPSSS